MQDTAQSTRKLSFPPPTPVSSRQRERERDYQCCCYTLSDHHHFTHVFILTHPPYNLNLLHLPDAAAAGGGWGGYVSQKDTCLYFVVIAVLCLCFILYSTDSSKLCQKTDDFSIQVYRDLFCGTVWKELVALEFNHYKRPLYQATPFSNNFPAYFLLLSSFSLIPTYFSHTLTSKQPTHSNTVISRVLSHPQRHGHSQLPVLYHYYSSGSQGDRVFCANWRGGRLMPPN